MATLLLLALTACSGGSGDVRTPPPVTAQPEGLSLSRADRSFLVDPLLGYPLILDGVRGAEIRRLHELLLEGNLLGADDGAMALLTDDPGLHPAVVLDAQVAFARGQAAPVVEALQPVVTELPGYTSAQLLLGGAQEKLGDVVGAYGAYRQAAEQSAVAARRLEDLEPRTFEILDNRLEDALRRGRFEEAEAQLERLEAWAPQRRITLEGARRLAAATDDGVREMAALRGILALPPEERPAQEDDRLLLERLARLETRLGDPRAGVEILRDLTERYPDDTRLAELLEEAKFGWRVAMLPQNVRELGQQGQLDRASFAVLLYWLVPGVRYSRPGNARIATDILEHPFREAIARVINQGLLPVDEKLHRFAPARPVSREEALASLLRALERSQPPLACLREASLNSNPSTSWVCSTAARCALIETPADCLPGAVISGGEALELIRRSIGLLTGPQDP